MKKILVIGAGFLQSFVIKKARSMGYFTLTVDANPEAVGFKYADAYEVIDITDEKKCLEYAKKEQINGVLTAATDYGVLTAAYVAEKLGLGGIGYETAKLIKNKHRIKKCFLENSVDDSEQAYEVSEDTDMKALAQIIKYPVMVKPCDGSGSRGASRVDSAEEFESACVMAMNSSLTRKATVESFIFGKEYGAESLVVNGEIHVLSIMRKLMTNPPYYAELGHEIPTDLTPEIEEKAKDCVKKAIKALGITFGSVNMDMIITAEGGVYIIDVGARMGGNMIGSCIIPYGTGIDYVAAMLANAAGDKADLTPNTPMSVATRLIAFGGGIVKRLPDFNEICRKFNVEIYHHLEVGQKINEYHTNLDGCGYIVAKSEDISTARKNAEKVLDYIKEYIF